MPFGSPVVPDVNIKYAVSSGPTDTPGAVEGVPANALSNSLFARGSRKVHLNGFLSTNLVIVPQVHPWLQKNQPSGLRRL